MRSCCLLGSFPCDSGAAFLAPCQDTLRLFILELWKEEASETELILYCHGSVLPDITAYFCRSNQLIPNDWHGLWQSLFGPVWNVDKLTSDTQGELNRQQRLVSINVCHVEGPSEKGNQSLIGQRQTPAVIGPFDRTVGPFAGYGIYSTSIPRSIKKRPRRFQVGAGTVALQNGDAPIDC